MSNSQAPASVGEVFDLIRSGRACTRSAIGRVSGLSRTAVSARLSVLMSAGLVVEGGEVASGGGRPATELRFDSSAGVVLALAIGRSRSQLAITDLAGTPLAETDIAQEIGVGPDELMPRLVAAAHELFDGTGHATCDLQAIGLSIPGTVDREEVASRDAPTLRGWDAVPLAPYFAEFEGVPIALENDANALVAAERDGPLRDITDLLVVKASTGLGVGMVVNGRLVRGAWGAAGELGHVKAPAGNGLECRCGGSGCLETVASGWALVNELRTAGHEVAHIRDVADLALAGDADARRSIRRAGRLLGETLATAVNLVNPAVIVVAGDLSPVFDVLAAGLREGVYADAPAPHTRDLSIVPATHGARSGVVGCANLALDAILSPSALDVRLSVG